jgi:hypothetical protein
MADRTVHSDTEIAPSIPGMSELIGPLYEAISKDPVSILHVVCLVVAVPLTLIKKATSFTSGVGRLR